MILHTISNLLAAANINQIGDVTQLKSLLSRLADVHEKHGRMAILVARSWILERWLEIDSSKSRKTLYASKIRQQKPRELAVAIGALLNKHKREPQFGMLVQALLDCAQQNSAAVQASARLYALAADELLQVLADLKELKKREIETMFKGVRKQAVATFEVYKALKAQRLDDKSSLQSSSDSRPSLLAAPSPVASETEVGATPSAMGVRPAPPVAPWPDKLIAMQDDDFEARPSLPNAASAAPFSSTVPRMPPSARRCSRENSADPGQEATCMSEDALALAKTKPAANASKSVRWQRVPVADAETADDDGDFAAAPAPSPSTAHADSAAPKSGDGPPVACSSAPATHQAQKQKRSYKRRGISRHTPPDKLRNKRKAKENARAAAKQQAPKPSPVKPAPRGPRKSSSMPARSSNSASVVSCASWTSPPSAMGTHPSGGDCDQGQAEQERPAKRQKRDPAGSLCPSCVALACCGSHWSQIRPLNLLRARPLSRPRHLHRHMLPLRCRIVCAQ